MPSIERETKLELDETDFERLKSVARIRGRTKQLNIYYDDGDVLSGHGMMLRIRHRSDGAPLLTLKTRIVREPGYRESREHEEPLVPAPGWRAAARPMRIDVEHDLPGDYADVLRPLGVAELRRLGWLRNDRWLVRLAGGAVELDRMTLPDGSVVHEAEIENDDPAVHRVLVEQIRQLAPSARPSAMGKFGRFRRCMGAAGRAGA